eukprot:334962_1
MGSDSSKSMYHQDAYGCRRPNKSSNSSPVFKSQLFYEDRCSLCGKYPRISSEKNYCKFCESQVITHVKNKFNDDSMVKHYVSPMEINNEWYYQGKGEHDFKDWTCKCKFYCKKNKHLLFGGVVKFPLKNDAITNLFKNTKECPKCKQQDIDTMKSKINAIELKQDNILDLLQKTTLNSESIKLSYITKSECDVKKLLTECKELIKNVTGVVENAKRMVKKEHESPTYQTKIGLNEFIKKATSKQNAILQEKQKLFTMEKQLNDKEINIIKNQNEIDAELINERKKKSKLIEQNENIDKLQKELGIIMEHNAEDIYMPATKVQKINTLFDKLLKLLHEKYIQNEKCMEELDDCKGRVNTILSKLRNQKSNNIYLCQLLDEQYNRLDTATQSALGKFEENGIYFLAVTVSLKQDIIDKFVNFGCDKLDDIKDMNEEDLREIGIHSKLTRKIILKHVKRLNENHEKKKKKKRNFW